MCGSSTFAALLPGLSAAWHLTNTQAGWIGGIYYAGYLLAVPILAGLTDRFDQRRIYLLSTALAGASSLLFALAAHGFWMAMLSRGLAGVGLAGTYMPGLKALTERIEGPTPSRAVAFYTASFGVGISLSFIVSGEVGAWLGWRWAFIAAAAGASLAYAIAALALTPSRGGAPSSPASSAPTLLELRPVLRNRSVMAYAVAYAAHSFELFGLRSWAVAFLVFSAALHPAGHLLSRPALIAAALTAIGIPASIFGNEIALKFGRRRTLLLVMACSALFACTIGFTASLSGPVVIALLLCYGCFVTGDSATLTAGLVDVSDPRRRGMTMAIYSCIGFIGAFAGPLIFGLVLDRAGAAGVAGWGLAFASMGIGVAVGPLALLCAPELAAPRLQKC
ncbi:MAG: MFS transporter [bacterium]|nr:MFS transporter [bacterium]